MRLRRLASAAPSAPCAPSQRRWRSGSLPQRRQALISPGPQAGLDTEAARKLKSLVKHPAAPPKKKSAGDSTRESQARAIAELKAKGIEGFEKPDPNAHVVPAPRPQAGNFASSVAGKKKAKRDAKVAADAQRAGLAGTRLKPTLKKALRTLPGNLSAQDLERLKNAKSINASLHDEAKAKQMEAVFERGVQLEKMEEKLAGIVEEKARIFHCKTCGLKARAKLAACEAEGHQVVRANVIVRFFECVACGRRAETFNSKFMGDVPCANAKCQRKSYRRASKLKQKRWVEDAFGTEAVRIGGPDIGRHITNPADNPEL